MIAKIVGKQLRLIPETKKERDMLAKLNREGPVLVNPALCGVVGKGVSYLKLEIKT